MDKHSKRATENHFLLLFRKSIQGATNIKNEILKTTKEIHFAEQYQKDEIEPNLEE